MSKYLKSDNELMKNEYNNFRKRLSEMVRTIVKIQSMQPRGEGDLQEQLAKIHLEQKALLSKSEKKLKALFEEAKGNDIYYSFHFIDSPVITFLSLTYS